MTEIDDEHVICLRVAWSDLYWLAGDEVDETSDPEIFSVEVAVIPEGHDRFRVAEPTSLTPFGTLGPSLNMGDIIHGHALPDGSYRILGIERCQARTWQLTGIDRQTLESPAIRDLLAKIQVLEGRWEWMAGTVTVQVGPEADTIRSRAMIDKVLREIEQHIREL